MRLIFIRHAEPNYALDCLTENGRREAAALAKHAQSLHIDEAYLSPYGRAQETAAAVLTALGKTGKTEPWLREFDYLVRVYESEDLRRGYDPAYLRHGETDNAWDLYPSYYAAHPELKDEKLWRNSDICRHSSLAAQYDRVTGAFDALLREHGAERFGDCYRITRENRATLAFFCHLGVICVILSHLIHCSPFVLWQGTCLLPSSVTEVVTEERQQGIASFRILRLGSVSHLEAEHITPSFYARFCECFEDKTLH